MRKLVWKIFLTFIIVNILMIPSIYGISKPQEIMEYQYKDISEDVRVKLDGQLLNFDTKPMIVENRTLVPFRVILEALGSEVGWNGDTKTVTAKKEDSIIKLQIGSIDAYLNQQNIKLDVSPIITDGRTLIPIRFISEALGCTVDWEGDTRTVIITSPDTNKVNSNKEFSPQGIAIGDSEESVIEDLGKATRKDLSKYGFRWYIYNNDYSKYIQVGIKDRRVVGIYTNATNWKSKRGIKIGTSKEKVRNVYGKPLADIRKGNKIYKLESSQADIYLIDDYYTTIFYDLHKNNTVTAVLLIEKETERALNSYYGKASEELKKSYERQLLDLANATRYRFSKTNYSWDDKISDVARKHSEDMAKRNYFSHKNPDGKSPFDRMEESNIKFIMAGENIAAGQPNAIAAHEGWMNSKGHRKNILGDYKELGIGVYFGGSYGVYYTQKFCTMKN